MSHKRALLSVSDKTNLLPLATALLEHGYELVSSGGTCKTLQDAGLPVTPVANVTHMPEMLDGRVKTLHPNIHGGLLACLDKDSHQDALAKNNITPISVLVVNLYPFKNTVEAGKSWDECIENIDIGGPAMVRAAAKNHQYVSVITDPADYDVIIHSLEKGISLEHRQKLAAKAFRHTADYDATIANYFSQQQNEDLPSPYIISGEQLEVLRYGENPHQQAAVYKTSNAVSPLNAEQLQGKSLSYNNLNDADAAFCLMQDLHQTFGKPTAVIIKHATPCGVAVADNLAEAWQNALAADAVSAFGGIVAFNKIVDIETAQQLGKIFLEVVIAPDFSAEALEILSKKKNLRLLKLGELNKSARSFTLKTITGGFLVQQKDGKLVDKAEWKNASKRSPTAQELEDMQLAFTLVKYVKSNAIVLAKNGASVGIGAGQTSRVVAAKIAVEQAKELCPDNLKGASAASDAFFPFADGADVCLNAGITAIIQPGGSKRDNEVIETVNKAGAAMMFSSVRHFLH